MSVSWQVSPAVPEDIDQIERLIISVGGDQDRMETDQFAVARDPNQQIIGCARLKPYPRFVELASLAVSDERRNCGVGRKIVSRLLQQHQGPIYLVCEDHLVEFFREFGFNLIPTSEMLPGLESKLEWYVTQAGHINILKRE